jgi:hypothetical protein
MKLRIFGKVFYDSDKPIESENDEEQSKKNDVKRVKKKDKKRAKKKDNKRVRKKVKKREDRQMNEHVENQIEERAIEKTDTANTQVHLREVEPQKVLDTPLEEQVSEKIDYYKQLENEVSTNKEAKNTDNDFITNSKEVKENKGVFKKIKRIYLKFKGILKKIKEVLLSIKNTIINIKSKIINISDIWHKIKVFLRDEINNAGLKHTFSSLLKILKHIRPTKLRAIIEFGTGDPCSTGQALGAFAVLYGYYGEAITIIPNFETAILEGTIFCRGRIRLFTLLIICIKLILDKNFRQLIKNFKAFKEEL